MAVSDMIYLSGTSETSTERPATVGQLREEQDPVYGFRILRPVRNTSGGALVAGRVVAFASGSLTNVAYAAAGAVGQTIAGIPVVDIPNGRWGWVVCHGACAAVSAGAVAANARIRPTGAAGDIGKVDDTAAAADVDEYIGLSIGSTAGADVSFTVRLSGLL